MAGNAGFTAAHLKHPNQVVQTHSNVPSLLQQFHLSTAVMQRPCQCQCQRVQLVDRDSYQEPNFGERHAFVAGKVSREPHCRSPLPIEFSFSIVTNLLFRNISPRLAFAQSPNPSVPVLTAEMTSSSEKSRYEQSTAHEGKIRAYSAALSQCRDILRDPERHAEDSAALICWRVGEFLNAVPLALTVARSSSDQVDLRRVS